MNEELEKRIATLEWKVEALTKTHQSLWEDYVERGTKRIIAPLEESLGCKIWEGFKK